VPRVCSVRAAGVHSLEDLILNKLRYFVISRQPKHVRDIVSILYSLDAELEMD
jgi:hypothetical protein